MEDLSDFIASAVEFLVGGVLFTIALAFLIFGSTGLPEWHPDQISFLTDNSTVVAAVFVAVVYATGVVAESLSRGLFEFMLDRATVRTEAFATHPAAGAARATRVRSAGGWRERVTARVLGGGYSLQDLKAARAERERQRAQVMTWHVTLHGEVQGQLKRLRLERVFTVSVAITTLALALQGRWLYAAIALAAMVWLLGLVRSRFQRYCSRIALAYRLVEEDKLRQTAPQLDTRGPVPGEARR